MRATLMLQFFQFISFFIQNMKKVYLGLIGLLVGLFSALSVHGQAVSEYSIAVRATPASLTSILVQWPTQPNTQRLFLYRKEKAAPEWNFGGEFNDPSVTAYLDDAVTTGEYYEYMIIKVFTNSVNTPNQIGYGFVASGVNYVAPPINGQILLVEDTTATATLTPEVNRLIDDLYGDGWCVKRIRCNRNDTPPMVRSRIQAAYNAAPDDVRMVLLLGRVPVPYSGNIAPDAHIPDHQGAWPADGYYGDMTGTWTDIDVNNAAATRNQNKNIPGDGKFDQSNYPDSIRLMVGRIDFANMPTFGTEAVLLKRYLDKNHDFRHRITNPLRRGLVDDNFNWLGGERPGTGALRSMQSLFGPANVTNADFMTTLSGQSYMMAYGSGAGSYTSAAGIGTSGDFNANNPQCVYNLLFGSYFGDWDSDNNFLRAPLAANGLGLASIWSGRPYTVLHHMGMGDPIGYAFNIAQRYQQSNTPYEITLIPAHYKMVHIGLMGDPSLRLHTVAPPSNLQASLVNNDTDVRLDWTASVDTALIGHIVYRLDTLTGCYILLTDTFVVPTNWTDPNPIPGFNNRYMVRVAKYERSTGTYVNWSQGIFTTIFVPTPTCPIVTLNTKTDPSCFGRANGAIDVNLQNGVGPFTYVWHRDGVPFGNTQDLNNIPAGSYTLTVTDANSCTAGFQVTLTQPTAIEVLVSNSNVTCFGLSNGTANAGAAGGQPNYTFLWSNNQTTSTITGLAPGTYTVTVTDQGGCTASSSVTVTQPNQIALDRSVVQPTCTGNTGSILLTVNGGAPTYTFAWTRDGNPFSSQQNLTGLGAGEYQVTVTDFNSCTATLSVTLSVPNAPVATHIATNVRCNGGNNGSIDLPVTGGTPTYTFAWTRDGNPFSSQQNLSNLTAGTYVVTVTDQAGCTVNRTVIITEPVALQVNGATTQITCNGANNGSIILTVAGGTTPYTFAWTRDGNPFSSQQNITGLSSGIYVVTVTDGNNCTTLQTFVINPQPAVLTVTVDNVTNAICGQGVGSVSITVNGGTGTKTFSWTRDGNIFSSQEDLTNLQPGTYAVTVTDANGCTATANAVVEGTTGPEIIGVNAVQPTCNNANNGSITVSVTGGQAPLTFSWTRDGQPFSSQQNLTGLGAGVYVLTVTDANGCSISTPPQTIANPAPINVTGAPSNPTCFGGSNGTITLTVSGGTTPYTFSWTKNGTPFGMQQNLTDLTVGTYVVTVRDVNNCTTLQTFVLTQPAQPVISFGGQTNVTICSGNVAPTVALSSMGGTGTVVRWERSTDNFATVTTVNHLFPFYMPGTLTQNTCFRVVLDNAGCVVTSNQACVTVVPQANPGTLSSDRTICEGSNTTLTISGNNAPIIRWERSTDNFVTVTTVNNTQPFYTLTNVFGPVYVRAVVSNGICAPIMTNAVEITTTPPAIGGMVLFNDTHCEGDNNGTLQLAGYFGNIVRWESSTNNFNTVTIIPNTNDFYSYVNLTRTTQFRAVLQSGSCPFAFSSPAEITIIPGPNGGAITGSTTVCGGTNFSTLVVGGYVGAIVQWESSTDNFATTTIIPNVSDILTVQNVLQTTQYRVLVTTGFCGSAYSTVGTITVAPNASGGTLFSDRTVCANNNGGILTLSGYSGPILYWEASIDNFATVTTLANTLPYYTYSNLPRDTWFRAVIGGSGNCPTVRSNGIKITAVQTAMAGELTVQAGGTGGACSSNTGVITMTGHSGTIVRWEMSTDNFMNVIIPITNITNMYTYSVAGITQFRVVLQNAPCPPVYSGYVTVSGGLTLQTTALLECNNKGKIVAIASGGTAPYSYFITPNSGLQVAPGVFTNLIVGTYTITARDRNNCVVSKTVVIPRTLTGPMITNTIPNGPTQMRVDWIDVAPGGNNVYYQLRYRPIGGTFVTRNVGSNTTYIITGLTPNTTYEVQVRVRCLPSVTYSTWSTSMMFQMREEEGLVSSASGVSLYPNPNSGDFNLRFEQKDVPATVRLYDMTGRMVYNQTFTPTEFDDALSLQLDLTKGVYNVQILQGSETKTVKMVIE